MSTNDDGAQTPLVCVIELRLTFFILAVSSHRSYRVLAVWATGKTRHHLQLHGNGEDDAYDTNVVNMCCYDQNHH